MLGTFLDDEYKRYVEHEQLLINNDLVFDRDSKIRFGNLKKISDFVSAQVVGNLDTIKMVANQGLIEDELFLSNGFKILISSKL